MRLQSSALRILPAMADPRATPAMQQYFRFKQKHPDCVLLFRIGDFYEMFDQDAVTVSRAIGLTLTQRTQGLPMCGVPYHQLDVYLRKLVAAGFRVAVCEQLIDADKAKGLVPRAVTRVITPGTLVDEPLLEADFAGTLAAIAFTGSGDDSSASVAIIDVSTGGFILCDATAASVRDELARRAVREVLYCDTAAGAAPPRVQQIVSALGISSTPRPPWQFGMYEALESLREHFGVRTLAGFGIRDDDPAVVPAGVILRYLKETQTIDEKEIARAPGVKLARASLAHLSPPKREDSSSYCVVDAVSLRALEIERTMRATGVAGGGGGGGGGSGGSGGIGGFSGGDRSLVGLFTGAAGLSKAVTRTAMGARLLREWLCRPLRDASAILARQRIVGLFKDERTLAERVGEVLAQVQDVPRIAGRLGLARATPRDLVALAKAVVLAAQIAERSDSCEALEGLRARLLVSLARTRAAADTILAACVEAPPNHLRDGGLVRDGYDAELDEARHLQKDAGAWLSAYQAELTTKYSLSSLKVGYNRVFGYYIELPAAQAKSAPAQLIRKQTLRGAERYTTPELREFEGKVLTAESRALERERTIFAELCTLAGAEVPAFAEIGITLAEYDALLGMGDKAFSRGWVCPEIVDAPVLRLHGARHPVLDEVLQTQFVPNDVELGSEQTSAGSAGARLAMITGPNMAGKSTYIRTAALLTLLAHAGSFVPADRATVGLTDRIFTRIGADDALHSGQSTFMVEMIETANILHHATARSLVVLDEIGRGTSTLDGLSLAWAIAEHLAGDVRTSEEESAVVSTGPRTLFATHYHELTDLEDRLPGRCKNLHVIVREWPPGDPNAQIVFLHRIEPGRTDQSYGVHVARLAGLPQSVITRAREVLGSLAVHHHVDAGGIEGSASGVVSEAAMEASGGKLRRASVGLDAGAIPAAKPSARNTARRGGKSGRDEGAQEGAQLGLFTEFVSHPAVDSLREMRLDHMTPIQAFDALRKLRELVDGVSGGS